MEATLRSELTPRPSGDSLAQRTLKDAAEVLIRTKGKTIKEQVKICP
jgi:hypothetical protein